MGKRHTWSASSKAKISIDRRDTMALLQPVGGEASRQSPLSGPYETNVNASVWIVVDPDGGRTEVHNLSLWCRQNADLFAPYDWRAAYAGMRQVAKWLRGGSTRKIGAWRGWSLAGIPKPVR